MSESDVVLLDSWVRKGDAEAFKVLAKRYAGMVYGTCKRILNNPAEAEDVAQECFEILATTPKPVGEYLAPWLHRVACNRSLTRLRSEHRRKEREGQFAAGLEAGREPVWDDIYGFVDEAIAQLPDPLRIPIVAHFLDDQTHSAIALTLGVPRSTITDHIDKGIELIRNTLKSKGAVLTGMALAGLIKANVAEAAPSALLMNLGRLALSGAKQGAVPTTATAMAKASAGFWTAKTIIAAAASLMVVVGAAAGYFVLHKQAIHPQYEVHKVRIKPVAGTPAAKQPSSGRDVPVRAQQPDKPVAPTDKPDLARPYIAGIVTDAKDNPLSGARVEVRRRQERHERLDAAVHVAGQTETGLDGRFAVDRLPAGELLCVLVSHPSWAEGGGLIGGPGGIDCLTEGGARENLAYRLSERGSLSGCVVDRDGQPISGATVAISAIHLPASFSGKETAWGVGSQDFMFGPVSHVQTDQEGIFEFQDVCRGGAVSQLVAWKSGYAPNRAWSDRPPSELLRLYGDNVKQRWQDSDVAVGPERQQIGLSPGGTVIGAVHIEETGVPVGGALVMAECSEGKPRKSFCATWRHVTADAQGNYRIDDLPLGTDVYMRAVSGELSSRTRKTRVFPSESAGQVDLTLLPPGSVEGMTIDAQTGDPVPGVAILFHEKDSFGNEWMLGQTTSSDQTGRFRIAGLHAGEWTLCPQNVPYTGYLPDVDVVVVPNTGARDCIIKIPATGYDMKEIRGALRITVVNRQKMPVPNADVIVFADNNRENGGVEHVTDDKGECFIKQIPTIGHIIAAADPVTGLAGGAEVDIEAGYETQVEIVTTIPTGKVSGSVLDPAGKPLPETLRVEFTATDDPGLGKLFVNVDNEGHYQSLPLPPYGVTVRVANLSDVSSSYQCQPPEYEITIQPGTEITGKDFVLAPAEKKPGISGVVRYPNGRPATGIPVTLSLKDTQGETNPRTQTDVTGHFVFALNGAKDPEYLIAGHWPYKVPTETGASDWIMMAVPPGRKDLDVVLHPCGVIRGRLVLTDDELAQFDPGNRTRAPLHASVHGSLPMGLGIEIFNPEFEINLQADTYDITFELATSRQEGKVEDIQVVSGCITDIGDVRLSPRN
jgi:RNA polymerase sigma factor (sigma-70 family)